MSGKFKTFFREALGLLLVCACFLPLNAQLDPRLQSSKTDFTNLYQQSTSLKAKPEILSIFDYSGSMAALMYHPLYRNDDKADAEDYRNMKFELTNGTTTPVVAPNNRYRIRAKAGNCSSAYASYIVTVGASGATGVYEANPTGCPTTSPVTYNTAPTYRIRVQADGNTNAYAYIDLAPTSSGVTNPSYNYGSSNGNNGTQTNTNGTFTITRSNGATTAPTITRNPTSGPYAQGTTVTFTAYLTHPLPPVTEPITPNITGMTWSLQRVANDNLGTNPAGTLGSATWTQVSPGLYKSDVTFVIPAYTPWTQPAGGDPTRLQPISVSPGTPFSPGATLTLNTYFITRGTGANNDRIDWSIESMDTNNQSCTPGWNTVTPSSNTGNTTSYQASKNVTWKIPAFQPSTCSTGGVPSGSYVTITLEASQAGFTYVTSPAFVYVGTLKGNTKSTSTGASTGGSSSMGWLIKPDGTPVTQADADGVDTSSGLRGANVATGSTDVRNWIRAASHVRFKNGTRTIDIPIPWKVMDRASTGNPLSSRTIQDKLVKSKTDAYGTTTTTTYGSGLQMELDLTYKIEGQDRGVFASSGYTSGFGGQNPNGTTLGTGAVTTAWLYSVVYKPSYISWLFNGKYQSTDSTKPNYTTDSSLVGKYIVFDAASTTNVAGQTNVSWGQGFGPTGTWGNIVVPRYNYDGSYRDTTTVEASKYKIPALTRVQAAKSAAIQTWIGHQSDVFWAFRFLDPSNEASGGDATDIDNDTSKTINASDATTTHVNGNDSGWKVLNNTEAEGITSTSGNSVKGMQRIAAAFARGGTPLTYAMARGLAQFGDPTSVFNSVVGSDVSQCVNHYLLLFTDGVDNNSTSTNNPNSSTPYIQGSGASATLNALEGNKSIIGDKTQVDRYGSSWNMFTFAGIGAHLSDPTLGTKTLGVDYLAALDPGTSPSSGSPSSFLPYAIYKRNGIRYQADDQDKSGHRITTMTVGVSLGGQYTDATSPKRSLFLAAVVGDPITQNGLITDFHSFNGWDQPQGEAIDPNNDWIPDPQDVASYPAAGKRKPGAVFFFDATDPDKLTTSLEYAFRIAIGAKANSATANPNLPFVGASYGKQVYMGNFQPPTIANAIWSGDLFMYGTKELGGKTVLIDKVGNQATVLDSSTAQWTASDALLHARNWDARKLYTRIPGGTALQEFKDSDTTYTDNTTGLKNFVAKALTPGSDAQKNVIRFLMGGDVAKGPYDASNRPLSTAIRSNIMGDIINSAPAALEYKWEDVKNDLTPRLSALSGGNRFRIILVGTNQGWLHAFGEVSKVTKLLTGPNAGQEIVEAVVDELWSFMPTELLANLDYLYPAGNIHRFAVDGTPTIYHLDLPNTSRVTNGVMDRTGDERAIAIIGLRKGGRSYYALDIKNPFVPAYKWSLVPDEADSYDGTKVISGTGAPSLDTVKTIVKNMGFSTCTPGIGRVLMNNIPRDAVFIGGGASSDAIDHNFPVYPPPSADQSTKLGRSILALDVNTGKVLAAQDLTAATIGGSSVGPIAAGMIPFEFVLNSGMAQRAYFLDYKGGLWAWGSKAVATAAPYTNYRIDTSELSTWSVRKVYQDSNLPTALGARYTTLPAPFRVGTFTGKVKSGMSNPAAVGIAMVSGDRNNPLDEKYEDDMMKPAPIKHRLTVVFDRQDSRAWSLDTESGPDTGIVDTDLSDFTENKVSETPANYCSTAIWQDITPSCSSTYYLKAGTTPKFGYYVNFPKMSGGFASKGINPPMVVAGSLFYTYFTPTKVDPCKGGAGVSDSFMITDVLNPIVEDTRTGIAPLSGKTDRWAGVASDFIALGTRGVLQGGVVQAKNPQAGASVTTPEIHSTLGKSTQQYPKPRVWRTVH